MHYRVYRDKSKRRLWRWTLIQSNNRILADSGGDGYRNLRDCYSGIRLVMSSGHQSNGEPAPIIVDKKDRRPIPRKRKAQP